MKAFVIMALMMLAGLAGCNSGGSVFGSTEGFPAGTGFQSFTVKSDGEDYTYTVFVPKGYSATKKYPTIVFLHGMLEAGSGGIKNLGVGIGPHIQENAETWPFITIFPQSGNDWQGEERSHLCMAALDDTARRYNVDPDRVILTGLSNGGQGVWLIGAAYKNRFAGLVPIAGHAAYDVTGNLKDISIWCFHNTVDPFVPSGGSEEMCERINKAGGHATFTKFSGFGHNCWDDVYSDPKVIQWMLEQRRGPSVATGRP